jgi:hypothetical protein
MMLLMVMIYQGGRRNGTRNTCLVHQYGVINFRYKLLERSALFMTRRNRF